MIIVHLHGGLGNQLFQYAAGRALSLRLGLPLQLDISWHSNRPERPFVLDNFHIQAGIASAEECQRFTREHKPPFLRKVISQYELFRYPPERRAIYIDHEQGYQPSFERIQQPIYLLGYFQSEKYFAEYAETIRNDYRLVTSLSEPSQEVEQQIDKELNAVSIHVRRGDYLSKSKSYPICSLDYYKDAMELLVQSVPEPTLFIFSDDPEWAEANLRLGYPTAYVRHNSGNPDKSFEDLWLLSRCRHHIIANSTFSWWGAWLAAQPDKIVIAPQQWFRGGKRSSQDLVPDKWIRVQS